MAKYDDYGTQYDDERLYRRQSYLDQMTENQASPSASAPSEPSPGPPDSPLPPSPPPNTTQVQPSTFLAGDTFTPSSPAPDTGPHGGTPTTGLDPYTSGVQSLYNQLLNRPATNADFVAQSQNPGGLAGIQQSILTSPEYLARQKQTTTNPTTPTPAASRTDPNYIRQQVLQWMQTNNPQGHQDPDYWVQRILATGGLGSDNLQYWQGRFTEAPGTHQEGATQGGVAPFPYAYTPGSGQLSPEIANYFQTLTQQIQQQIAQQQQVQQAQRDALLRLMRQGSEPVDVRNDPTLRGASDAYRLQRERGAQKDRAALAERAAFTGLNSGGQGSGAFDSGIASIGENASQDIAGYDANLAVNELSQRRQLLVQAIQIADAIGARNEAQSLNATLAQIDAALKEQQLGFNYAQLGQQQGQFEDTTAYNYANLLANQNRAALLYGLGG